MQKDWNCPKRKTQHSKVGGKVFGKSGMEILLYKRFNKMNDISAHLEPNNFFWDGLSL